MSNPHGDGDPPLLKSSAVCQLLPNKKYLLKLKLPI